MNFAKSEIVQSDHGLVTHASRPLFRHCDVTATALSPVTEVQATIFPAKPYRGLLPVLKYSCSMCIGIINCLSFQN